MSMTRWPLAPKAVPPTSAQCDPGGEEKKLSSPPCHAPGLYEVPENWKRIPVKVGFKWSPKGGPCLIEVLEIHQVDESEVRDWTGGPSTKLEHACHKLCKTETAPESMRAPKLFELPPKKTLQWRVEDKFPLFEGRGKVLWLGPFYSANPKAITHSTRANHHGMHRLCSPGLLWRHKCLNKERHRQCQLPLRDSLCACAVPSSRKAECKFRGCTPDLSGLPPFPLLGTSKSGDRLNGNHQLLRNF